MIRYFHITSFYQKSNLQLKQKKMNHTSIGNKHPDSKRHVKTKKSNLQLKKGRIIPLTGNKNHYSKRDLRQKENNNKTR